MPTLQRPDTVIHYELAGSSGPPVLLIQGIGAVGGAWRLQVDAMKQNHRVLVLDNRGIGRSQPCAGPVTIETMAEDALAVMDAAGWDSAHVGGHSMGGVIAQQLALAAPRRVRSLLLVCTFSRGKDAARPTPWAIWMGIRTRLGTRRMRRRAFLEMLYSPAKLAAADRDKLAAWTAPLIGRDLADSPPVLMKQVAACGKHDTRARLGELAGLPALVISAELDPIAKVPYGRDLAAQIPGATFELHSGQSHGNLLEQPVWLNERLVRFIALAETRR
jgi:pimeloyl-ACP methyl ester carboxylesterase